MAGVCNGVSISIRYTLKYSTRNATCMLMWFAINNLSWTIFYLYFKSVYMRFSSFRLFDSTQGVRGCFVHRLYERQHRKTAPCRRAHARPHLGIPDFGVGSRRNRRIVKRRKAIPAPVCFPLEPTPLLLLLFMFHLMRCYDRRRCQLKCIHTHIHNAYKWIETSIQMCTTDICPSMPHICAIYLMWKRHNTVMAMCTCQRQVLPCRVK